MNGNRVYGPPSSDGKVKRGFYTRGFSSPYGAGRSAQTFLQAWGVEAPKQGVHYDVGMAENGAEWHLIPGDAVPEKALASFSSPSVAIAGRYFPLPASPAAPDPKKEAARPAILRALIDNYDVGAKRWKGKMSDAYVATALLDVPVEWVAEERARWGPDANEPDDLTREISAVVAGLSLLSEAVATLIARVEAGQ